MPVLRNEERGKERPLWWRHPNGPRIAACRHNYYAAVRIDIGHFGAVRVFVCAMCGHHKIV